MLHEIETLNDEHFKRTCNWLQMLTQLIEDWQDSEDPQAIEAIHQWTEERDKLR
ncbi:5'-nucleotidase domain-containing protein 3 [Homalodisca vitripennis]|nr:5'-nucleotidase domain-containing protein 3 [Homalodisca vitripennis]